MRFPARFLQLALLLVCAGIVYGDESMAPVTNATAGATLPPDVVTLLPTNLLHTVDFAKYQSTIQPTTSQYEVASTTRARFNPAFYDELRDGLNNHGLVIINNINLEESEYMELVSQTIGTPPLDLPNALVPSKLPGYPEIARVANFGTGTVDATCTTDSEDNNTKIDPNYSFGHYWHHDGDFWPEGKNRICNFLHSKIVAQDGGQTGFISTIQAYAMLDSNTKQDIENATVVVDPANIKDFQGISPEDWNANVVAAGARVEHPVVQQDVNQPGSSKSLYLPFFDGKLRLSNGKESTYDDLFKRLFAKDAVQYYHTWSENQIVVWDNLKVMHRAMGETKGRRLLWRAQGRVVD